MWGVPCVSPRQSILITTRSEGLSPRAVACDSRPDHLWLWLALAAVQVSPACTELMHWPSSLVLLTVITAFYLVISILFPQSLEELNISDTPVSLLHLTENFMKVVRSSLWQIEEEMRKKRCSYRSIFFLRNRKKKLLLLYFLTS